MPPAGLCAHAAAVLLDACECCTCNTHSAVQPSTNREVAFRATFECIECPGSLLQPSQRGKCVRWLQAVTAHAEKQHCCSRADEAKGFALFFLHERQLGVPSRVDQETDVGISDAGSVYCLSALAAHTRGSAFRAPSCCCHVTWSASASTLQHHRTPCGRGWSVTSCPITRAH